MTPALDKVGGEARVRFGPGRVADIPAVQDSHNLLRVIFLPFIYMHKMNKFSVFSTATASECRREVPENEAPMSWTNQILVIRPDRIGDVILSTPVFDALKAKVPGCKVTVLVRAQAALFQAAAVKLAAAMEAQCWDGDWYLRGFFDSGAKLGSHENAEARIDSIPQSWAAISGAGEPLRTRRALQSALDYLVPDASRIIRLFTPPFDHSEPHPGYIMGYPPGLRENGGQYTHAAIWLAMAFARLGDGATCGRLLDLLNPVEQARDPKSVERYAAEPYVISADIYTAAGLPGRGGWSWYTGSASWLYRVWIEEVLGLRVRGDHFSIEPCVPPGWTTYSFTYRPRGASYHITVTYDHRVTEMELTLDTRPQAGNRIPIQLDSGAHEVMIVTSHHSLKGTTALTV